MDPSRPSYPATLNADLHCHSNASDGRLSPTELVDLAVELGVELLALTDHDSVDGLQAAAARASERGLAFVPGVELSVTWENRTLHVLGLNIDACNTTLQFALQELQRQRKQRAEQMAQRLEYVGLADGLRRAADCANGGQITRTHFARLLVEDGLCKDLKQAFKRYLGAGKPACVRSQWIDLSQAIKAIHAAGGLAVLAHPLRYRLSGAWRDRMYKAFKQAGGDGLEVSCGASQQPHELDELRRQALAHGLLASRGSDFHGPEQRWLKLGHLAPLSPRLSPVWTRLDALQTEDIDLATQGAHGKTG